MNKNKKFCVYEHVFPNGKKYIGITCKKPNQRWENGTEYSKTHQSAMYYAIQKYGWDNIEHNILFNDLTEKEAKEKEKELIKKYHTFIHDENPMGYNMTLGGDGLHYKDADFSIIKCREDEKNWDIIIDKKHFHSQRDFANYIQEEFSTVCLWLNKKNPMPLDLINHGLQVFVNGEEIIYTNIKERILGWEYKGQTFKNLQVLADYLNIDKKKLWYYLKHPERESAKKYLPLKNIHKIEIK